jgi:valyl-tRNA synthetase
MSNRAARPEAIRAVEEKTIYLVRRRGKQLLRWMREIKDWCVFASDLVGTPDPVLYSRTVDGDAFLKVSLIELTFYYRSYSLKVRA